MDLKKMAWLFMLLMDELCSPADNWIFLFQLCKINYAMLCNWCFCVEIIKLYMT